MAGLLKLTKKNTEVRDIIEREFSFTPSSTAGQGYTTGGDTLNFLTANYGLSSRPRPPANPLPSADDFIIKQVPAGFTVEIIKNTVSPTLANYLLKIWNIATAAELAQADYPAALYNDAIRFIVKTSKKYG